MADTDPRQDDAAPNGEVLSVPETDFDDTVGFASPRALEGRVLTPAETTPLTDLTPEPLAAPLTDAPLLTADAPDSLSARPIAAPALDTSPPETFASAELASPAIHADVDVTPAEAASLVEVPAHSMTDPSDTSDPSLPRAPDAESAFATEPQPAAWVPSREDRRRQREAAAAAPADDRVLWAYTVYALILFAVPTLGVSAALGVLAVTGRAVRAEEPVKSHYIFQQRTLWSAAVLAAIGLVLIPIGLGVFVLFGVAVWTTVRGAYGVFRLKAFRPIDNPRSWLI